MMYKVILRQAKSFKYQECDGRQYGFIAQDIKPLIPELVNVDNESEENICIYIMIDLVLYIMKQSRSYIK